MKIQKEAVGASGLDASAFKKYERVTVEIVDGATVSRETITYDDGKQGTRTRIPVLHGTELTNVSFGKTNVNRLVDALGEDTEAWSGATLDLIVVEYPSLGKMGFDIEAIRAPTATKKAEAPQQKKPEERALELCRELSSGKGAPISSVLSALQAETGISAEAAAYVIMALKNSGMITETKGGLLRVVAP